ncbi:diguanylate cyclase (GGDEF) domain-containing protein [Lysobacter sp. yr284]|uniref:GGDEF domain-containing protein n=1 Tax=Lysobacter TaxID=68 RepID=UPI0008968DF9|nr:sensor domain-containing diguanylate cyclase [Lysobacter sp. yr284]SDY49010.1 diguanylate cyclase (GGDEF) domain-containing protein [Lysobacter sp. yr284]
MQRPETPANEARRLQALRSYDILDTPPERDFDDLVAIAAAVCDTPIALVSLIDEQRQWFKARTGLAAAQTPRELAFCAHAILRPDQTLVVPDARDDARFAGNPLVLDDPNIRFYAGAPLVTPDGHALGTLCVIDTKPRGLADKQHQALTALSRQASRAMELRRVSRALVRQLQESEWYERRLLQYQCELEASNAALEASNADLAALTRTDPLTGLPNRRAFALALEQAVARSHAAAPLQVALLDIDHFKTINDVHGHAEGDRVLLAVADALRLYAAGPSSVARYGGEEFLLLFEAPQAQAQLHCEFVREAIANLPLGLPLTVSIGLAAYRTGEEPAATFARADQALYAAKRGGRNRVVLAEAE